jgi:uncharacterized membrane protein YraQ (UPF0718 family)
MDQLLEALKTTGTLIWYTLWAFILGYTLSAAIQVLFTREQMSRVLGERGPKQAALSGLFGFISSSCSFAALAASRSVLAKGAHPANATAFLIATTNLVLETGIVLWLLVGWRFVLANFLLGIIMIAYAYVLSSFTLSKSLGERAQRNARKGSAEDVKHPSPEGMTWWQKLTSKEGWRIISFKFFGEWKMAYKEVLVGFTIAGLVSAFVPESFWNSLFPEEGAGTPGFLTVLAHAAIAPLMAFFTFVGSLGNIPLAAILWSKNATFGGVMSFLGADLVAATVIYLNAKYYGWRFTAYLSGLLYVAMVAAGVTVHYLFAAFGAIPQARPEALSQMMEFGVDTHTFWLNIIFGVFGIVLLAVRWRAKRKSQGPGAQQPKDTPERKPQGEQGPAHA